VPSALVSYYCSQRAYRHRPCRPAHAPPFYVEFAHPELTVVAVYFPLQIVASYPKLSILYLHGNSLGKLREVTRLASLKELRSLTLHGNEIEKEKDYRLFVIHTLPQLRKLDFVSVTPSEREQAARSGGGALGKRLAKAALAASQ
jgi:hypothetical protein